MNRVVAERMLHQEHVQAFKDQPRQREEQW